MRSGPPTTTTDVRLANSPPLQVRPTATAEVTDPRLGGLPRRWHSKAGHANHGQAGARAAAQDRAFRRVPIPAPHHHHVVVDVLCGCEDEILGHGDAGHRATARVDLDDRRRRLFGCVGQL